VGRGVCAWLILSVDTAAIKLCSQQARLPVTIALTYHKPSRHAFCIGATYNPCHASMPSVVPQVCFVYFWIGKC